MVEPETPPISYNDGLAANASGCLSLNSLSSVAVTLPHSLIASVTAFQASKLFDKDLTSVIFVKLHAAQEIFDTKAKAIPNKNNLIFIGFSYKKNVYNH